MVFKKIIENFLENNPEFTSEPFPIGIIGGFILASFPVCLFIIFPYIESDQLKISLHGLLNPITLGLSYFLSILIFKKIPDKAKAIALALFMLLIITGFGTLFHLHLPVHMPEDKFDKFFTLLPGSFLGFCLSFLWLYLSKGVKQQ